MELTAPPDRRKLTLNDSPLAWARRACDTVIAQYTPDALPPANRWHYHQGVFLQGMEKLWRVTGESVYLQYIQDYVDLYISPAGDISVKAHLDDLMPGQLLLLLEQETGELKYRRAAARLRERLDNWQTTPDGGFWHKDIYPNQMWLDGIYMAGPFAVKYGLLYNEPGLFDLVVRQALLMHKHMADERTGLLYHAWDHSRQAAWADKVTGRSPEFWGRSVGWYGFALAEILDYLPGGHPQRNALVRILSRWTEGVRAYQDHSTGLWYQVVDKGDRPDNWLELSCSTLFVFGLSKASRAGIADSSAAEAALRGYESVLKRIEFTENGFMRIPDICVGTSAGTYEYYVQRERKTNDLHGIATFVHMCMEMELLARS